SSVPYGVPASAGKTFKCFNNSRSTQVPLLSSPALWTPPLLRASGGEGRGEEARAERPRRKCATSPNTRTVAFWRFVTRAFSECHLFSRPSPPSVMDERGDLPGKSSARETALSLSRPGLSDSRGL